MKFRSTLHLLGLVLALVTLPAATAAAQDTRDKLRQVLELEDQAPLGLIRSLGNTADAEALAAVEKAVTVLRKGDRLAAAYQSLAPFAKVGKLSGAAVEILVGEASSRPPGIARHAVKALAPFAAVAEKELLALARGHQDQIARAQALRPLLPALQQRANKSSLKLVLDQFLLRHSGSSSDLEEWLAAFPLQPYRGELRTRLRDSGYPLFRKRVLLQAMARQAADGLHNLAQEALSADDDALVLAALGALAKWGGDRHAKSLDRLSRHADPGIRLAALREGLRLGRGRAVTELAASADPVARQAAAIAYAEKPAAAALPHLNDLLGDAAAAVRHQALFSLAALRDPQVVPLLIGHLDHAASVTADRVLGTLEGLTGESFGPSARVWQRWWQDQTDFQFPSPAEVKQRQQQRARSQAEAQTVAGFWGMPVIGERIAFVLDTSDSMKARYRAASRYGGQGTRLSAAQAQLVQALRDLPDGTAFNIYLFDRQGWAWRDTLATMDSKVRAEAVAFVMALQTRFGTALYDALELAFAAPEIEAVYLLSDGAPYLGKIDDPALIRADVAQWNATRQLPLHCVSLGGRVPLLQQLAKDSGGEFRLVK